MTVRKGSIFVCQKMSGVSETCGVTHDYVTAAKREEKKVNALRLAWPQKVNALFERTDARVENFVGKNFALEGLSHN